MLWNNFVLNLVKNWIDHHNFNIQNYGNVQLLLPHTYRTVYTTIMGLS